MNSHYVKNSMQYLKVKFNLKLSFEFNVTHGGKEKIALRIVMILVLLPFHQLILNYLGFSSCLERQNIIIYFGELITIIHANNLPISILNVNDEAYKCVLVSQFMYLLHLYLYGCIHKSVAFRHIDDLASENTVAGDAAAS